eukprot:12174314-Ditylum_brightwellii.AAC.1
MDRITTGDLTIEYCPTGMMIGHFFTKALQGKAFRTFRDMVMNVKIVLPKEAPLSVQQDQSLSNEICPTSSRVSPQECVGKSAQSKTEVGKTGSCVCRGHSSGISGNARITIATKNKIANSQVSINMDQEDKTSG